MGFPRNSLLLKATGLMLLVLLVPVQAAGCCKLASLLGLGPGAVPQSAVSAAEPALATGPACCPKGAPVPEGAVPPVSAGGNPDVPCPSGSSGCCLTADPAAGASLASEASAPAFALPALRRTAIPLPVAAAARPRSAPPADAGPPPYLHFLRLMI